jgi:hypothetical protein
MPREHFSITMTDQELRTFLGSFNRLVLATVAPDEGTWGDAVAYHFDGERVYFRLPVQTRSYANISRDKRVCCVVESSGPSYYDNKAAMLHGEALEVPAGASDAIESALARIPDPVDRTSTAGSIFSVGLDNVVSFAFDKIRYRYADRPDL